MTKKPFCCQSEWYAQYQSSTDQKECSSQNQRNHVAPICPQRHAHAYFVRAAPHVYAVIP
jgi:hypothetical protein